MAASANVSAQAVLANLSNQSMLLMRMKVLSFGKNYDVMDASERVLCQVGLDSGQNVKGQMVGAAIGSIAGDYLGRYVQRSLQYTYTVKDPAGNLAYEIRKGSGGNTSTFTIVDPAVNAPVGRIEMKRSLIGGLKATWVAPDSATYFHTKGNIIRRQYSIVGPNGQEAGHVRHKILAIRDVWQLSLNPGINHLYAALFAVVLDFEKKM